MNKATISPSIAFIGSAGVPNRYGGFESFLEHCGPRMVEQGAKVTVTCDAALYTDHNPTFKGMRRLFLRTPANGAWSVLHDLLAFFKVFVDHSHIVVLGVSGGLWFPLFRLLCQVGGKRLSVNIDGIEWRRSKFSPRRRSLLKLLDSMAQRWAHDVVVDSEALLPFVLTGVADKTHCIAYSGDHVLRRPGLARESGTALTICRIEPENHVDLLIEGFLQSGQRRYTVIGNWQHSAYSRTLRQRYAHEPRLQLLAPIYDPELLAHYRETAERYLHGHSVGGTNPSLVEMLFYDCELICFDVSFNRCTAGACAQYFSTPEQLAKGLDQPVQGLDGERISALHVYRARYTAQHIAAQYLAAIQGRTPS